MGLVKNHKGPIQSASAHVGEGSDFDGSILEVLQEAFGRNHVAQGVVERLHIGVQLFFHVSGQKTQGLSGFHGGAREYQPFDFFVFEGSDG